MGRFASSWLCFPLLLTACQCSKDRKSEAPVQETYTDDSVYVSTESEEALKLPNFARFDVGFNLYRSNLLGGRHANLSSMRAFMVGGNGLGQRELAPSLIGPTEAHTGARLNGWSPNGRYVLIGKRYNSPENIEWEERTKQRRFSGWQIDTYLYDLRSEKLQNLTALERVSNYNTNAMFWPGDSERLTFFAIINDAYQVFSMKRDGSQKKNLTRERGFAYGLQVSPDGKKIAYQNDYRLYVANADGSGAQQLDSGQGFNFGPQWSYDSKFLVFVAGKDAQHADVYVAEVATARVERVASRGAYNGSYSILDVDDYHEGSSDTPRWSTDGRWIYFTKQIDGKIDLVKVSLADRKIRRLTQLPERDNAFQPEVSPDGNWIVYGVQGNGRRRLEVVSRDGRKRYVLKKAAPGWGVVWPMWRPPLRP